MFAKQTPFDTSGLCPGVVHLKLKDSFSSLIKFGISGVVVDTKLVFQTALGCNASSIILLHNHPSGTLIASDADRRLTDKLKNAGTLLDIPVLDHVIFTSETYYSMADEGIL